jgi:serine phosphatase RsbU (regulator of sigma subunit)/DNA-binding response OmpR family regulator
MISLLESGATREPPADPVSVLIVDDELGMRETLVEIFANMGYAADTAECGQEAIEKFACQSYNLALLDIRLPDMPGTDLLIRLKETHPDTLYIIATGYASIKSSIEALNHGAYAYITKPLDLTQISTIFDQAIKRQQLERVNRRLFAELSALSELTNTALSTLELDELLARLLGGVIAYLKANAGAFLLYDEHQHLRLSSAIGLQERQPEAGLPTVEVREGVGFVGRVAEAREPVVMDAPELWEQDEGFDFCGRGIQSALGVRLVWRGQPIGVAHVDSAARRAFSADEIRLLQVLADRAAVVIHNARLYAAEQELRKKADQREREARALSEVAHALVATPTLSGRLETLAQQFVRVTGASRCLILLREGDALTPQAVHGLERRRAQILVRQSFDLEDAAPALRRILALGMPIPVEDARSEAILPPEIAARWDIRSPLLVPLHYQGQLTGLVALDEPGVERCYTEDQLRMARALAYHATVAIETAKTFEAQVDIARTLQESFLSPDAEVPPFDIASRYEPASAVAQVGGDYFDFIELDRDRLGIVMGDVCGKGLAAAIYTAMAKYILRAYAVEDPSPASVVTRLNHALHNQMSDECMFITLVYGVLHLPTGEFVYANAAHPPPLLYRPVEDCFEELITTGGMVGAVREMEYGEHGVTLRPQDVLALFTDGVTEARTSEQMLESEGVQEVLRQHGRATARQIADAIYNRAVDFSSNQLKDDLAIVVIRARPRLA